MYNKLIVIKPIYDAPLTTNDMYSFWTIALVWCDPEVIARRPSRSRSDREMSRRNEIIIIIKFNLAPPFFCPQSRPVPPAIPRLILLRPPTANVNSAWRSVVAPFPRFYRINPRPIRRVPAIFAGSPRTRLLYSAGDCSPGKNARGRARRTWPREKWPPSSSPAGHGVSSFPFFAVQPKALFAVRAPRASGRSIFPRVLIRAFPKGNHRFPQQSPLVIFFFAFRVPRVFRGEKTTEKF